MEKITDLEQYLFEALWNVFRDATSYMSSWDSAKRVSFDKVPGLWTTFLGIGPRAVPMAFRLMEKQLEDGQTGWPYWVPFIREFRPDAPDIPEMDRGVIKNMNRIYLQWAKEEGIV